jgi:hypothetical protein
MHFYIYIYIYTHFEKTVVYSSGVLGFARILGSSFAEINGIVSCQVVSLYAYIS